MPVKRRRPASEKEAVAKLADRKAKDRRVGDKKGTSSSLRMTVSNVDVTTPVPKEKDHTEQDGSDSSSPIPTSTTGDPVGLTLAEVVQDYRRERDEKNKLVALLEERDNRIRELELELKQMTLTAPAGPPPDPNTVASAVTENSLSNDAGKRAMDEIAAEWCLTVAPETVCEEADELRPFRSPFRYQHWGPLANGERQYIETLQRSFLLKMRKIENVSTIASFTEAYNKGKPKTLRSIFKDKRRNYKSDKIVKRVEAYRQSLLRRIPALETKKGWEWRLDPERARNVGPGSCPFFTAVGGADIFDDIFSKTPAFFKGRDPFPDRRYVSITQLAMLDAAFKHKFELAADEAGKVGTAAQGVKNYAGIAKGLDKNFTDAAVGLAVELSAFVKDKDESCSCCWFVDFKGLPLPLNEAVDIEREQQPSVVIPNATEEAAVVGTVPENSGPAESGEDSDSSSDTGSDDNDDSESSDEHTGLM